MHSFDPRIAARVGVNAAVLYQNIVWWCEKNAANNNNEHDGRHWTYNSVKAWSTLFPYMTEKQIRTALDKLEAEGLIASGIYNKMGKDRTKWYSANVDAICPVGQSHLPLRADAFAPEGRPLPDSKPDIKPDVISPLPPKGDRFEDFWSIVPKRIGKGKAQAAWVKACRKADPDTIIAGMQRYANERDGQDQQYTAHPTSWLNAERWTDEYPASQQDFHNMISQALGGTDAISGPRENDHVTTQRLPAPLQEAGPSGPERGADRTAGNGRGDEWSYSNVFQPKRFGGSH